MEIEIKKQRLEYCFEALHSWLEDLTDDDRILRQILLVKLNELLNKIKYNENDTTD